MRRAVFFDRDGVINKLVHRDNEVTCPWNINEFVFYDDIFDAVDMVKRNNYLTFVVTNQPHVNIGDMTDEELSEIHSLVQQKLNFDEIVFASVRNSRTYKPNNGMIEDLIDKYNVDRHKSFIIGDRWKDIEAGHKSFLKTIFIGKEYTKPFAQTPDPDFIVNTVYEATKIIVETQNGI